MARTVVDVALLDAVISGETDVDPIGLSNVRLGIYKDWFFADLDQDTDIIVNAVLERLAAAGVVIVAVEMPELNRLANNAGIAGRYVSHSSMAIYLERFAIGVSLKQMADAISGYAVRTAFSARLVPPVLDGFGDAEAMSEAGIASLLQQTRQELTRYYIDVFQLHQLDALIFPTTPSVAVVQGPEANARNLCRLHSPYESW